jgi:hypothetical protein
MKRLLLGSIVLAVIGALTLAADIPAKAPYYRTLRRGRRSPPSEPDWIPSQALAEGEAGT